MVIPNRLSRNIGVLTEEEQVRLLRSTVAVVGLGCTGCAVVEFLARAGVGGFILIDGDRFDETNINRQIYAKTSTLGEFKAKAARNAIFEINPEACVVEHATFLQPENATTLLQGCDLVVNGVDDPFAMIVLHRTAQVLGKTAIFLLSGCIPFQGVCSTISADGPVDYETFMGLPTAGKQLDHRSEIQQELFEKITKRRVLSALSRGAIPGEWVDGRLRGEWVPSFGPTSNITSLIAANEAIKVLIGRPGLEPVRAPQLIYFDGSSCRMIVQDPQPGVFWFQGDF